MATNSDYETAVVRAVQELTRRVEQSELHADEERAALRAYVEAIITAFRKDVHLTTVAIQLRAVEHDRHHWLLAAALIVLTLLGIANIVLASYLIGRGL